MSANSDNKMTGKCKICLACACCWVLILAVMIPVGIFVIAPKMAQSAIDQASFHVANSSIYGVPNNALNSTCPECASNQYNGWLHNDFILHSPMFLGAKLHAVNVTLIANQPGATGPTALPYGFSSGEIGWFTMPETTIKQGDNSLTFDVAVHFDSTGDGGFRFATWAFYAWGGGVVYLDFVAEPTVTALGFINMKTKLKKTMQCNCIKDSPGCTFPKSKPEGNYTPSTFFVNDSQYFHAVPDKMTREPDAYPNETIIKAVDYLPLIELFCEPVDGDDVYNGSKLMPVVITTTTTTKKPSLNQFGLLV